MRDPVFARLVRGAYRDTCALTGICIRNAGNSAEMEAAHINSVEAQGPDSVRNGLALSRTVHWLFDHGFVSLQSDGRVMLASHGVPDPLRRLIRPMALLPDARFRPHPEFLRWHHEEVFKG